MAKSITSARKRGRGRPRVDATPVNTRFPPDELAALDAWIERENEECSRPEAVRRLVARSLMKNPADTPRDLKLLAKVSAWAKAHKMTVSEALPTLLEQALAASPAPRKKGKTA